MPGSGINAFLCSLNWVLAAGMTYAFYDASAAEFF